MSTQINVYVGGHDLPDRAKREQEGNRWRQGETERQREIDRSWDGLGPRPEGAGVMFDQDYNAIGYYIPIGRRGKSRFRPDELAANRQGSNAFIAVINSNAARDDAFHLYIAIPSTAQAIKQPGVVDFSTDYEITIFVWTRQQLTVDAFRQTAAGKKLEDYVNSLNREIAPGVKAPRSWREANRMTGISPRRSDTFALRLVCVKQNNNGNYGDIVTGITDDENYVMHRYSDNSLEIGEDCEISYGSPQWGIPLPPT